MKDFFYKHPAILATVIYIQITTIGIMYSWFYYGYFNINIFDFSEANDFLLAAFKNPIVFIISFFAFVTWSVVIYFSVETTAMWTQLLESIKSAKNLDVTEEKEKDAFEKLEKEVKESYDKYRRRDILFIIFFAIYSFGIPAYFGHDNAKDTKKDSKSRVLVRYTVSGLNKKTSILEEELILLGTSEKFTFFYNNESETSLVMPTSNLFLVQIQKRKKKQESDMKKNNPSTLKSTEQESTE